VKSEHSYGDPYVPCTQCGTSRPKEKLVDGKCGDGFCKKVAR
jgi:hypothetical protein